MKASRDMWLSEMFGHDVFRVSPPEDVGGAFRRAVSADALTAAAEGGDAFFFCKVPVERVDQVAAMTAGGFNVVDVNISLEREPARLSETLPDNTVILPEPEPAQHEAVLEIAENAFAYSRFHLDPHIPRKTADGIKRVWIENYIRKVRGDQLLVAVTGGKPSGFLAILGTEVRGRATRVHDLLGVDKRMRGRGIGRSLINFSVHHDVDRCALLRMGTQVANRGSVRLYESCGFRYTGAAYVLHAHVRNGRLVE